MTLSDFANPKCLIPRLRGDTRESVVREMASVLDSAGKLSAPEVFLQVVLQRERQFPTILDQVALPHGREGVGDALAMAVGIAPSGIPWGSGQSAQTVFLCAVPEVAAQTYLCLLSGLSEFLRNEPDFSALRHSTTAREMFDVLARQRIRGLP